MSEEKEVASVVPHDEIVLVNVEPAEMDEDLTRELQAEVLEAAGAAAELPVVLNLANVQFLPSLSIGALVSLLTEFKQKGRRFILVDIQPSIRDVLAITRLDKVFEIHDDVEDALEHIRLGDASG
jgi:anti-anti-sigma factor